MYRLRYLKLEIKWAWQRLFKGHDDRIYFDPDLYLAEYINKVSNMKLDQDECNSKEEKELQQLSFGMGSYLEMCSGIYPYNDPEYKRLKKEFKIALKLLPKYFCKLWY